MPQNMRSSDRFRTVFISAVVCQLFQAPYSDFPRYSDFLSADGRSQLYFIIQNQNLPQKPLKIVEQPVNGHLYRVNRSSIFLSFLCSVNSYRSLIKYTNSPISIFHFSKLSFNIPWIIFASRSQRWCRILSLSLVAKLFSLSTTTQ